MHLEDVIEKDRRACGSGSDTRWSPASANLPTPAAGLSRSSVCPPMVLRGAKLQGSRVEVVLDWIRLRGPMTAFAEAERMFRSAFGKSESRKGRAFYERSLHFEAGAELWCGSERDDCVADMPGGALAVLEPWERWQLVEGLRHVGFMWTTRLDVAVDFRGEGQRLVDATRDACEAGELCGARVWQEEVFHDGDGVAGSMVRIGRRGGNGSGRYVRVYDKGLETGTADRGCWERWEVEFTGQCAESALVVMLQSENRDLPLMMTVDGIRQLRGWVRQGAELALGAVDFREMTGARLLRRRSQAAWWKEVVGVLELRRVRVDRRRFGGLGATAAWVRTSVAPTVLSMSRRTGRSVEQVFLDLVGDFSAVSSVVRSSVLGYELQYGENGVIGHD